MDYVIADLEATCWQGSRVYNMEIIEIGAVYLDGDVLRPVDDFQQFVKPTTNPILTDFCRDLTAIQQRQIESAPAFPAAFDIFLQWIGDRPFRLCSWGAFDFDLFDHELTRHDREWPRCFSGHVNLKKLYSRAYSTNGDIGIPEAMRKLQFSFEGRRHRGIDDAKNVARVAQTILPLDRATRWNRCGNASDAQNHT
jgi:3'-5' exoribonuclease 1